MLKNLKSSKVLFLEDNEIFAMNWPWSILGVDMIKAWDIATYPFTLYNDADEGRTYRISMVAGWNLPMTKISSHFKLYEDVNLDGKLDLWDVELSPYSNITLNANVDKKFLILHSPDFNNWNQSLERYGRKFSHGWVTFQEIWRLRSASYAVRTWQGTEEELLYKDNLISQMVYPSSESDYIKQAERNQDKPNNPRLIRNTPDFKMARSKYLSWDIDLKILTRSVPMWEVWKPYSYQLVSEWWNWIYTYRDVSWFPTGLTISNSWLIFWDFSSV